jgi:hypothetical protein
MVLFVILSAFAQAQVVLTDDANTSSFFPTTNFGASVALIVCSGSNTYIKFSTANLGSGVTASNVSKATLTLYVDAVLTSGAMDVYQVNGSWSEGKITYNSAPALGTKLFSAVSVSSTGYLSLDMTSTVQAWLSGTQANNGIALVPSSGSKISVSFDSKENIFTSHNAQLNLVLVSAGPQGPQGPQGVQGPQGLTGAVGPQGAAGPAGPAGATGLTGPAGQQGPQGLMGLTGMTGATGAAGPAGPAGASGTGFNFRNTFDNSASYAVNDVVTFQGASYVATAASQGPNNPTPDQNPSAWSVMAAQGAAGAAGAQGPSGSAGPVGPPGPVGATGPVGPAGPVGPPGSGVGGFNGLQEFTTSGTFTVPAGITQVLVELWGAGGGGGGPQAESAASAGGGGAGGYTRAVFSVIPGAVYNIVVGTGGVGGPLQRNVNPGINGTNGSASQVTDSSSNVLVSAGGGGGGFGVISSPSLGGSGGVGGGGAPNTIGRNGADGMPGQQHQEVGGGGAGGIPASGSISTNGVGLGGTGGDVQDNGKDGAPGYILITW